MGKGISDRNFVHLERKPQPAQPSPVLKPLPSSCSVRATPHNPCHSVFCVIMLPQLADVKVSFDENLKHVQALQTKQGLMEEELKTLQEEQCQTKEKVKTLQEGYEQFNTELMEEVSREMQNTVQWIKDKVNDQLKRIEDGLVVRDLLRNEDPQSCMEDAQWSKQHVVGHNTSHTMESTPGMQLPNPGLNINALAFQPHLSNSVFGADLIKRNPREFNGKVSWDAYRAQFELLAEHNGWDDQQQGVQLTTSLKEVLGQLTPEESGSYSHLVRGLEQRYRTTYQHEVFRARFHTRDLDGTGHKAYPGAPFDMLSVLVRDQFVDTLDSVDLKIQVKQAQPKNLAEALARALKFKSYVRSSTSNFRIEGSSGFRAKRMMLGESKDFRGSCWNCGKVRDVTYQSHWNGCAGYCTGLWEAVDMQIQLVGAEVILLVYMAEMEDQCLLGLDFLTSMGCSLNLGAMQLKVRGKVVPMGRCTSRSMVVKALRAAIIPPRSEIVLPCRLKGFKPQGLGMVDPNWMDSVDIRLMVGRTLVDPGAMEVPVVVAAFTSSPTTICQGVSVGQCIAADHLVNRKCDGGRNTEPEDEEDQAMCNIEVETAGEVTTMEGPDTVGPEEHHRHAWKRRKHHSRQSDTIRDAEFVAQLQAMVDEDPSQSMRSIARELQVSEGTIRKCLHEDIRYKSYKMHKGQLPSIKMQENCFKKTKKMVNKLEHPLETCSVCSEGEVMPLFFFPQGLSVSTEVYIDVLQTHVKLWIEEVAAGRPYLWQQDLAPCHTSRKSQKWLL
ncbi:hypothetical protein O3P69_016895 [Scylla paramamosain]|uniref:Transposase n=1 Tax=Scylla paramamosain TaxID=85552 RepID=A0AAW0SZL9_SCYPA